jgi:hypothetical protein
MLAVGGAPAPAFESVAGCAATTSRAGGLARYRAPLQVRRNCAVLDIAVHNLQIELFAAIIREWLQRVAGEGVAG